MTRHRDITKCNQILALKIEGLSFKDIGKSLGISLQRVEQLISPPLQTKRVVYRRANHQCENCQKIIQSYGNIHHVKIFMDYYTYNNPSNLLLLCRSCHRKQHYILQMDNKEIQVQRHNIPLEGTYYYEGINYGIKVIGYKNVYGKNLVLITPVSGNGQKWVNLNSVNKESTK